MKYRRGWVFAGFVSAILLAYLYSSLKHFSEISFRMMRLQATLELVYKLSDSLGKMPEMKAVLSESTFTDASNESQRKLVNEFRLALQEHDSGTIIPVLDSSGDWLCGEKMNRNRNAALFAFVMPGRTVPGDTLVVGDSVEIVNIKTNERYPFTLGQDDIVLFTWVAKVRTLTAAENAVNIRSLLLDVDCCE